MGEPAAAEWVSIHEATRRLGCSVDTVRRRIRDGTFGAVKRSGRYGPAWYIPAVELPAAPVAAPEAAGPETLAVLVDLVTRLSERVTEQAERIGYLRAQLDGLQGRGGEMGS
jgi:excisionase family DNA binding protein